jgi:cephalosporin hydroxylase
VSPLTGAEMHAGILAERDALGSVTDAFHKAFYTSRFTHNLTNYRGVPILKNPMDLWIYQEILWDLQPTLIIETGTAFGGSAVFFGDMLARRGRGHVISIDIEPHETLLPHPHVSYVTGSSTDAKVVAAVRQAAVDHPRVMVVLDSDHSRAHVLEELAIYAPLVTQGQFLVVEDTNIDCRPVPLGWMGGPGPGMALDAWLPEHPEFQPDVLAERMLMTFYPGGWLRRV